MPGQVLLRLTGLGTYVQTQHDDHDVVVGQGGIDIVHDQDLTISEARLAIDVGLSTHFGASLMFPVRMVNTTIRYLDRSGAEVRLASPSTHHRNETVTGIADPMVLGSGSWTVEGWRLTGRVGFTIPIGRTEDDPFALGDMGLPHQHIQFGTGTVNPVVAGEVARSWGAWRAGLFVLSQQVVYESSKGYQAGDRYAGGVAVRRRLGKRWSLRGGVDVLAETAERWNGIVQTDDGNRGRIDLIFGAGASWAATDQLGLDLSIKIPAITYAVNGQLDMPAIVELGVSWSFGGPKAPPAEEDDHGHEHGDDHGHDHGDEHEDEHGDEHGNDEQHAHTDATGLDVADLGKPGEAVDLVPVAGKITIFDFWAVWCQPCKILDPALVEIARAYPDIVAIRRIDTVDWESAAVARYLTPNGFNLPHLKIFDPSGRMVLEESSAAGELEALIEKVRALVQAEDAQRKGGTAPAASSTRR